MRSVLDASALLAVLLEEDGQERVVTGLHDGVLMCTVNFAEAATRYGQEGATEADIRGLPAQFLIALVDADEGLAAEAALIGVQLPRSGLSLGDRFCLALARRENLPALTADRVWSRYAEALGVQVALIR